MDEPCDWDICTEASTPGPLPQLSRAEKKQRAKPVTDQTLEHSSQRQPEKTTQKLRAHREVNPRRASPAEVTLPQPPPPRAEPTRKELQDALPKIPPLSSFKTCRSRFMTFEEAERDFHSFITTGLGRSVEVIRDFRGGENGGPGDQNGQRESFTLTDDGAPSLKQNRWKKDFSPPRSASGSSSLQSDEDDETDHTRGGKCRAIPKPQTEARQTPTVCKPKAGTESKASSAPRMHHQKPSWRTSPQPENYEPVVESSWRSSRTAPARNESRNMKEKTGKWSKKSSEKMNREKKRERDEEEQDDDEEEEWSAEAYWRASYRAWNDYYASMSPFQDQGYQSYYSVAHNWMAAYRMNAVYMEELMKH